MLVQTYRDYDLSEEQCVKIARLEHATWPIDGTPEDTAAGLLTRAKNGGLMDARVQVIWDDNGEAIAHAQCWARPIRMPDGMMTVMALGGVCVAKDHRQHGLGAAVVRACFARVDAGEFPVALFQTGVPRFYENLGARQVSNPFINSLNTEAPGAIPWWDPYIMIYPVTACWPDGVIDLVGPAF